MSRNDGYTDCRVQDTDSSAPQASGGGMPPWVAQKERDSIVSRAHGPRDGVSSHDAVTHVSASSPGYKRH